MAIVLETGEFGLNLDEIDREILYELQADARLSYSELGRRIGLSAPAATERVRRMEDAGIIEGYSARVVPERLGYPITAFVSFTCPPARYDAAVTWCKEHVQVRDAYHTSGDASFVMRLKVQDVAELEQLLVALSALGSTSTTIAYSTVVEKKQWP